MKITERVFYISFHRKNFAVLTYDVINDIARAEQKCGSLFYRKINLDRKKDPRGSKKGRMPGNKHCLALFMKKFFQAILNFFYDVIIKRKNEGIMFGK